MRAAEQVRAGQPPVRDGAQTGKAYAALRQVILQGQLPPGTRLFGT